MSLPCRLIYVLDRNFIGCTAVSLYSALETAGAPLDVTIYTVDLQDDPLDLFHGLARHPNAAAIRLMPIDLSAYPEQFTFNLPRATCGRLAMVGREAGRAVYLDGDTLVLQDITELHRADLNGQPLGASLDTLVRNWLMKARARRRPGGEKYRRMLAHRGTLMPSVDFDSYFNAGVLFFDFDRIHALGLVDRIMDPTPIRGYPLMDQDHLNEIFAGRVALLDPAWNSQWGNLHTGKGIYPAPERAMFRRSRRSPAVIHYTGPRKPWLPLGPRRFLRAFGVQQILQLAEVLRRRRLYREAEARMTAFLQGRP
ncbi:glycosyltransferase family 8 protein [Roseicyclus persicicus]|uniref:Glycosyl transferase n=1 Tax=Roseicyclus persicicus TaxID=2650661 RepID=A0A7X6GZE8_9RHOB|nr:glycosyltransferase [Roseibacterium persicicum]NKX45200.1 hypothetical protein [Roseibacterium persicicum]